ncbi:hypothetical protein OR16_37105 [Cupriavidus basilensis OR16]|uniref:Twin-arginine translocation signal domain-containing protein n=1 Tax=Cupriavidus basilensis OR16 TaxID=1127483 RepID=H1SGA6_9BURK|nr:hypothetical protein [Cupriavidus basilensis]EHP38444.1 hypothetical protein OR16_37105 [Cupriavidus basilensis OR16]
MSSDRRRFLACSAGLAAALGVACGALPASALAAPGAPGRCAERCPVAAKPCR